MQVKHLKQKTNIFKPNNLCQNDSQENYFFAT